MNFTIIKGMQKKFQDTDNVTKVKKLIRKGIPKMRFQKGTNAKRSSYYSTHPNMDACKGITTIIHSKWPYRQFHHDP